MNTDTVFIMLLGDVHFTYTNEKEFNTFLDLMFAYSDDRKELYEYIMGSAINHVLYNCTHNVSVEKGKYSRIIMAIKVVKERYGDIYDPEQEMFTIVEHNGDLL